MGQDPRPNVHVIASVDESTYVPDSKIKMGDHPVIWSNDKVAGRNVYIFMGHSPVLFESDAYKTIFRNAIFWAANKPVPTGAHDANKGWPMTDNARITQLVILKYPEASSLFSE